MRDFPVFSTEYGVASLVLREIPYQGAAYITIRDSLEPEKLLKECVDFCRICGAERIYATGHPWLERYPLYTAIWQMHCQRAMLPETDALLFPVQEATLSQWRECYNQKVQRVPNGAWMTEKDGAEMLKEGSGYFVHRDGELLGIGKVLGKEIQWVASVKPGAGRDVVCALAHAVWGDTLELAVASENKKAVKLYQRLGFLPTRELHRWYTVFRAENQAPQFASWQSQPPAHKPNGFRSLK